MDAMIVRFSNPPFVAFASVSTAVIFCFVGSQRIAPMRRDLNCCGTLKVFCNAFTAAGCGALSQVFLKVVATACREAVEGKPAILTTALGVSLVGLVVFAPLQLVLLNTTLANSPAVYAVPLYQTILIVFTIRQRGGGAACKTAKEGRDFLFVG